MTQVLLFFNPLSSVERLLLIGIGSKMPAVLGLDQLSELYIQS